MTEPMPEPMSDPPPPTTTRPPLATLDYTYATNRGRPGLITAIGVISIIVACLSGIGSLFGTMSAFAYYMMSRMPAAAFAPPPVPAAPPTTAPTPGPTTAAGAAGSATVVNAAVRDQSFSFTFFGPGAGPTTAPTTAPATAVAVAGAGAPMFNPLGHISPVAAILSFVAQVLSLGLAIFLLVAGILTLRDSPSGAKLHRWYAMLKIPQVICATAAGLWLSWGVQVTGMSAAVPQQQVAFMQVFVIVLAVIPALIALAYPVALLVVLRSRTVREYYHTVRA
jgi:hypothetical protein